VITGRLVGDDAVLAWLRASPNRVAAGLARAITNLGIDLQRRMQDNTELQIDQSADGISATLSSGSGYASGRATDLRANLRRHADAFARPTSRKAIRLSSYRGPVRFPRQSFIGAALENLDPEVRDAVEAALRDVLSQ
jgi:hypothetical protein